jgi:hypothetical protein
MKRHDDRSPVSDLTTTRRRFLQSAALGIAGAAAPGLLFSPLLTASAGASTLTSSQGGQAASPWEWVDSYEGTLPIASAISTFQP